jgi:hypothetical protein
VTATELEHTTYQGFPLLVTEKFVGIHAPDGRFLCRVKTVKQARLFIKGYRKEAKR